MEKKPETGKGFFDLKGQSQFNVHEYASSGSTELTPYSRRDYYKISVVIGKSKLHYADRSIEIDRPALVFSNPLVPYSFSLGFEYPSYFNNFFKKNTGVTPLSIRK